MAVAAALPGEALAAMAWAAAVGYFDIRDRRVPNALTFPAIIVAVASILVAGRSLAGVGWASAGVGSAIALLLTLPGYLTRRLGAGDVKLLLSIAVLGGATATLLSFVVGALLTVTVAWTWAKMAGVLPMAAARQNGRYLPFGAGLAVGFIVAVATDQTGGMAWPY